MLEHLLVPQRRSSCHSDGAILSPIIKKSSQGLYTSYQLAFGSRSIVFQSVKSDSHLIVLTCEVASDDQVSHECLKASFQAAP